MAVVVATDTELRVVYVNNAVTRVLGRGVHSSTLWLHVTTFCGIRGVVSLDKNGAG